MSMVIKDHRIEFLLTLSIQQTSTCDFFNGLLLHEIKFIGVHFQINRVDKQKIFSQVV